MSHQIKNNSDFYVVGGTLRADAPSYIERKADRELYEHILKGDFCCVLTPRQMGKSSLMIRTADRLKKEGIRTAIIDLTQIGTEREKTSADKWYYGIAYRIVRELDIKIKLSDWWQEREKLPALQRLTEFFEDVLLPGTHEPVVIFVDEIDTTIALPFTDDFFAAVRACYNARAAKIEYRRLNFVLLGVANPSDLIKDSQRTPFNIGHGIQLGDFTLEEAKPLSLGLCADPAQGEKMLARILYWTGGHPYLTQKLCRITAGEKLAVHSDEAIDNLVEKNFLAPGANRREPNLKFVSDRLLQDRKNSRKRLKLYRRIYREKPVLDDPLSPTHTSLKLSGLVLPRTRQMLGIRNRIYEKTFTGEWIREVIPVDWNRYMMAAAVLLIGIFIVYMIILPKMYIETIRSAQADVPSGPYDKLKGTPFYKTTAENLMAGYWDRRAFRSELEGDREKALFYRLEALETMETTYRRKAVGNLTGKGYENLLATYYQNRDMIINVVAFTPNAKSMVIGSNDGEVQLWYINNYPHLKTTGKYGDNGNILSLAISPGGEKIVAGGDDGKAVLWKIGSDPLKKIILKHREDRGNIWAVVFSPDGKIVVSGGDDSIVHFWDADNGQPIGTPMKHNGRILAIAYSPDGKKIVTGSDDGTARLWRVYNCHLIGKPMEQEKILRPYLNGVVPPPNPVLHSILKVAFSPDGKRVLTGSFNSTAQLWNSDNGQPIVGNTMKHNDEIVDMAFSPDGKRVLTGCEDKWARLWRVESVDNNKPIELIGIRKHDGVINSVNFSPNSRYVVTGSDDGAVMVWRSDNGKPIVNPMKNRKKVIAVSFTPDSQRIITVSPEGIVRLFKVPDNPYIINMMEFEQRGINSIDLNAVDNYIVRATDGGIAQLLGIENNKLIRVPLIPGNSFKTVAFSRVDNCFVTGRNDDTAQVWDIENNYPIGKPMVHDSGVNSVAFSPDGKRIVTGSDDGTARLWSFNKNQIEKIGNPMEHEHTVNSVAFSPDGKRILTGSGNGKICLWSGDNASLIGESIFLRDPINAVAFSRNAKYVIIATTEWIYRFILEGDILKPQNGRLLPGKWSGIYRLLDNDGYKIQVALYNPPGFVNIYSIRSDILDEKQIDGNPVKITDGFEEKLGLKLNTNGEFLLLTTSGWRGEVKSKK